MIFQKEQEDLDYDLVKLCVVNARLAFDAARCCVTSGNSAVVEKKNLCVLLKAEFLAFCYSPFYEMSAAWILYIY